GASRNGRAGDPEPMPGRAAFEWLQTGHDERGPFDLEDQRRPFERDPSARKQPVDMGGARESAAPCRVGLAAQGDTPHRQEVGPAHTLWLASAPHNSSQPHASRNGERERAMALAATRTGSPQALGPGRDGREAVAADASRGSRESLSRPPSLTGAETRETVWPIRTQIDDSIAVLVRLTGNVAARPPRA